MPTKKSFLKYTPILFLIIISAILFYENNTKINAEEDSTKVVTSNLTNSMFSENTNEIKQKFEVLEEKTDIDLIVLSNQKTTLKEENSLPEYVTRLMELQKQQLHDPNALLKIEELPKESQIQFKKWLLSYQEQGYIESAEVSFDAMELQNSQVSFIDLNNSSITVPLQNIKNTKLSKYKYLGVISGGYEGELNGSMSSVKRLYSDDMGREISFYESSMVRSKVVLVDEFVSDTIKGYPATRMTFCTPSKRCTSQLQLIAKGKLYEITVTGDKESTKDILVDIASSLELPNIDINHSKSIP